MGFLDKPKTIRDQNDKIMILFLLICQNYGFNSISSSGAVARVNQMYAPSCTLSDDKLPLEDV
jgi:hypothetical protein